jgi:enamine deaminase RidA (YjgF/YER057c/UK114 family)
MCAPLPVGSNAGKGAIIRTGKDDMAAVKTERSPEAIDPYAQARRAGDLIFVSGGSTGTNFFALCRIAAQMIDKREKGSLVTLI